MIDGVTANDHLTGLLKNWPIVCLDVYFNVRVAVALADIVEVDARDENERRCRSV